MSNKLKLLVSGLVIISLITIVLLAVRGSRYNFAGIITGESYDPKWKGTVVVPNVKIFALDQDHTGSQQKIYKIYSNKNGEFEFNNLPSGHYQILFRSSDKTPSNYYQFDDLAPLDLFINKDYTQKTPLVLNLELNERTKIDIHKEAALTVLINALENYKNNIGQYPISENNDAYVKLEDRSIILQKLSKYIPGGYSVIADSLPISYKSDGQHYFLKTLPINFPARQSIYLTDDPQQGFVYSFSKNNF